MWRTVRIGVAGVVAALVAGCGSLHVMSHVPLSTMVRMASFDIADIDPAILRVAARLPKQLEPKLDGVKMKLSFSAKATGGNNNLELNLEHATEPAELAPLAAYERPDARLWVFRLTAADAERIAAIKAVVVAAKANGDSGSLSIGIGVGACHRGGLGDVALPTSTFLRTDGSGYFVLAADLDLRSIPETAKPMEAVLPCS